VLIDEISIDRRTLSQRVFVDQLAMPYDVSDKEARASTGRQD
jgi:hypothetical protein